MISINNRRYIGSKTKLLENIYNSIPEKYKTKNGVFADVFAGTGVVANYFGKKGYKIIVNDILFSNIVAYKAFFSREAIDGKKIDSFLNEMNSLPYSKIKNNYFSNIYGDKYFSVNDAKKIGYIRDTLEERRNLFNDREYYYILCSLLYATDRIANTCGHFESFLSKKPIDTNFQLDKLDLRNFDNVQIFNEDANELVSKIKCDIAYVDPPYNARQYVNFYHVLENLARWEKPTEFEGNSMKFKRNHLKSGYSRSKAPLLMEDLIMKLKANVIVVSYNNTYDAKSGASNNKITEEQLVSILEKKGKVSVTEIDYKFFNSGKTDLKNHKEKIYVCEVNVWA